MFGISEIKCEARQAMAKEISEMEKREKNVLSSWFSCKYTHRETQRERERKREGEKENILAIEIDIC